MPEVQQPAAGLETDFKNRPSIIRESLHFCKACVPFTTLNQVFLKRAFSLMEFIRHSLRVAQKKQFKIAKKS